MAQFQNRQDISKIKFNTNDETKKQTKKFFWGKNEVFINAYRITRI